VEQRRRDSRRELLNQLEIAPDGPHARIDHAEGCFFKSQPADHVELRSYSTHLYPRLMEVKDSKYKDGGSVHMAAGPSSCVPHSFGGSFVRSGTSTMASRPNGIEHTTAIFGVGVQHLACTTMEDDGGDSDAPKLEVPAILVEITDRMTELGASTGSGVSAILGEKSTMEPAALQEATHIAAQIARRYNDGEGDLVQSSDDLAVWAALLRQWHEEMPTGGRLLSWPRSGAHTQAMELGAGGMLRARISGGSALNRAFAQVEDLLRQLEPRQRGSIIKLIGFFAQLDRKQAGLNPRGNGAKRNELERTLARWWLDPAHGKSKADRAEQEEAGAGFVALLLNFTPSDESDPATKQALGELKDQRKERGMEASRALIEGQQAGGEAADGNEDGSETEEKKSTALTGKVYTCIKSCPITAGLELTSRKVATLRIGEKVEVMEEKMLPVKGALPGPTYDSVTGEVEESTSPAARDAPSGEVHRVRFQQGSQECWASVHSRHGVPLLKPRLTGTTTQSGRVVVVAEFGKERYEYGMSTLLRPDSLGREWSTSEHRRVDTARGERRRKVDAGLKPPGVRLGQEWARSKQGQNAQMRKLWKDDEKR